MKAIYLLCASLVFVGGAQAQNLSPRVERALRFLPPHSETLAVDQSVWTVRPQEKQTQKREESSEGSGEFAFGSNLQSSTVLPRLVGRTIELSMEARSNFRPPKGLGLMPYDGCGLLYLKPQRGQTHANLELKLLRGAKQQIAVQGQKLGVFETKREHDLWRVYVAVPSANVIVLATERASLETTLGRMKTRTSVRGRAFPASWGGWKWVDTQAKFWAVRRLGVPGSMGIDIRGRKDGKAEAFIMFSRAEKNGKSSSFVMRYQGDSGFARRLFTQELKEVPGQFQQIPHSNVAQLSIRGADETSLWFYGLGLLGTGIYL